MSKISVVIGANYGDEGKGLVTDYLSNENVVVVRYNGGAQAGHTVMTPSNVNHVFSHIGSGSFSGAKTYLSQFFISNPILFRKEYNELQKKGCSLIGNILVNPYSLVTTPFDMYINRLIEIERGNKKHGSCGLGINETVVRSNFDDFYRIRVWDLTDDTLEERLAEIATRYFGERCSELGLGDRKLPSYINLIVDKFLEDCKFFIDHINSGDFFDFFYCFNFNEYDFVFEGAQGLQLCETNKEGFPHVTRSKPGLDNIETILNEFGFKDHSIDVYYVTRCYLTRHGNGSLPHEYGKLSEFVIDKTNSYNSFQGELRYTYFDVDLFASAVKKDMVKYSNINPKIVVTHLDQLGFTEGYEQLKCVHQGKILDLTFKDFSLLLSQETGVKHILCSRGRTKNCISEVISDEDSKDTFLHDGT